MKNNNSRYNYNNNKNLTYKRTEVKLTIKMQDKMSI